ncbi:MAG: alcohol dehydrogenase catalytic domain-containing protein [Wenzhouxiangellaceae bacterium]|nr:alcohol dehydrogenase catalytic domain-containing protein [Wenzhouxiangellaceae bacterium]
MRAMVLNRCATLQDDSSPLTMTDLDRPRPGADEVLIRVHVCGVCHTELDQLEGRIETPLPRVLGHQVVGTVIEAGDRADPALVGRRVGVGWIASACGECKWCRRGEENLCPDFSATGRDIDGGYAEYMTVAADFVHPIPRQLADQDVAPMLCAGAIGLRSLRLTGLENGQVLGLTGFGASNHLVLSLARAQYPESPIVVWARDRGQREQALERGAAWAGDTQELPPQAPDAIIDTTPVWTTVLAALERLAPGGRLVINAIAKEDSDRDKLAELDYADQLWREKEVKTVANVTRRDIAGFLELAARHKLTPHRQCLPLEQANQALKNIRFGDFRGAFVLTVAESDPAD